MRRFFVSKDLRLICECFADKPANPECHEIVTSDQEVTEPYQRYIWSGSSFIEEPVITPVVPVVVPQEISKAQGIATLMDNGYWQEVNTYLTTQAPPETLTLFNAVTVFNRASPLLLQMQTMLGIPDAEVDQMFIDGAQKVI